MIKRNLVLTLFAILNLTMLNCSNNSTGSDHNPAEYDLTATVWQLNSIGNQDISAIAVPPDELFTIRFTLDSTFSGIADCNAYGGTYQVEGLRTLTTGEIGSTQAYCGDESLFDLFMDLLGNCSNYDLVGTSLRLSSWQDNQTLVFESYTDPVAALRGYWQWQKSIGGIAGHVITPESENRTETYLFAHWGAFNHSLNDTVSAHGEFTIQREMTPFRTDSVDVIHYEDYNGAELISQILEFSGPDSLKLTDLCYDCYEHYYFRVE